MEGAKVSYVKKKKIICNNLIKQYENDYLQPRKA